MIQAIGIGLDCSSHHIKFMKSILEALLIVLILANKCLAANKEHNDKLFIPKGPENVYLGMPMSELLEVRHRLESGTDLLRPPDDQGMIGALLNDPNDPQKIDIVAVKAIEANWPDSSHKWPVYGYSFKEKTGIPLLETIYYHFPDQLLNSIWLGGYINTRKEIKKYPQNRDKLLVYLMQRWGKPDKVLVGEEVNYETGAHECYAIELKWDKRDVSIYTKFPVDAGACVKDLPLVRRLFWRILANIQVGLLIKQKEKPILGVILANPKQKVAHSPFYKGYKPVRPEETERLLKSIKYYEILEKSLKTRVSNLERAI
ncbi:MAG: hypothetical protein A2049_10695 [Elusimicrobia bacterium GWA2_62_23]|nr:MAG: hypothetical protein A2049_10695 [Elusimicrobia bacterium GWA2_62_23]